MQARNDLADLTSAVTHDQKTALAGQIARACAVFCVDEIVVFHDGQANIRAPEQGGYTAFADPNFFLYHVLTYLETPPQMRRSLFPMHPDLRTAGTLPSLDMPHHLRSDEWCQFREGVTTGSNDGAPGTVVECGVGQRVVIPDQVEADVRVTVELPAMRPPPHKAISAHAVAPETPRLQAGYYWGYAVRQASSLGAIFTECPFDGGYDISIGTSERGADAKSLDAILPTWNHLLVVFGGPTGLEPALKADRELQGAGVGKVKDVFDHWVNLVQSQGSRTIRTEEALWIGLTEVSHLVERRSRS